MTRLEVLFLLHNFSQCGLFFFGRWENFVSIFSRRFLCSPDWKKTTIRRIAVREAGISRQNGGPPTPKIPRTITATIVLRCLRVALNQFFPTVPTFAVRETASLGIMGAPRVPPLNP